MHVILGMYKSTEIFLYYLSRTKFWTSYRFLWHIWILWDVWFLCFEKIEKILTWWWDLRLLPSSAHTMTATFAHLHLAASLNIPTKTFFSVRLTNSNWSTKLTSTFTPCWQLHSKLERASIPKMFQGYSTENVCCLTKE